MMIQKAPKLFQSPIYSLQNNNVKCLEWIWNLSIAYSCTHFSKHPYGVFNLNGKISTITCNKKKPNVINLSCKCPVLVICYICVEIVILTTKQNEEWAMNNWQIIFIDHTSDLRKGTQNKYYMHFNALSSILMKRS